MLKYHNYSIVFQEVPGEITLAINLTNCPNRCKGCHSTHLQEDIGTILDEAALQSLLATYGNAITCVCFMGGDAEPKAVEALALFVREHTKGWMKCAWYSGRALLPESVSSQSYDYIKLGPYIEHLGGLDSPDTNQRFYHIEPDGMSDRTRLFWKERER